MQVLTQLISSDAGLLSLAAFAGMFGIAAVFFWFLLRHVNADSKRSDKPR